MFLAIISPMFQPTFAGLINAIMHIIICCNLNMINPIMLFNGCSYRFDDAILVNGTWLSDEKVLCISPQHNAVTVKVEISISRDLGFDVAKVDY